MNVAVMNVAVMDVATSCYQFATQRVNEPHSAGGYAYDFGDDWQHVVVHEGFESADDDRKYTRCVGEGRCPPEDCGGRRRHSSAGPEELEERCRLASRRQTMAESTSKAPSRILIARGLRAERKGKVFAGGGYFGAVQLLADIETRFRVPAGGGRATDPDWTERRLVPLAPRTLERLEAITASIKHEAA